MAGENHCIFGLELGGDSWIYIDPDQKPWLVKLDYVGLSQWRLSFTAFGIIGAKTAGIAQYAIVLVKNTENGDYMQIDDILPDGSRALIVSFDLEDYVRVGYQDEVNFSRWVRSGFEISISGTPPNALVSATIIVTEAAADGDLGKNYDFPIVNLNGVDYAPSGWDKTWNRNRTVGICYQNGIATKVLLSVEYSMNMESTLTPIDIPSKTADCHYQSSGTGYVRLEIGDFHLDFHGTSYVTGVWHVVNGYAGSIINGVHDDSHNEPTTTITTPLFSGSGNYSPNVYMGIEGTNLLLPSMLGAVVFQPYITYDKNNKALLASSTIENSLHSASKSGGAIYPVRLANGLYGLAVTRTDEGWKNIIKTDLYGLIHADGVETAANLQKTNIDACFNASRHQVTGEIATQVGGLSLCFR
jgi:hypothetical protein